MISRPTPIWYDDAKLGIFVHWGLYSVPGWATPSGTLDKLPDQQGWQTWYRTNPYAEWYGNTLKIAGSPTAVYHREHYGEAGYADFIPTFNQAIAQWDPAEIAEHARAAGA